MCLIHLASAMDIRSGRRQRMTSLRQRRKQPSLFVADAGVEPRATSSAGTGGFVFGQRRLEKTRDCTSKHRRAAESILRPASSNPAAAWHPAVTSRSRRKGAAQHHRLRPVLLRGRFGHPIPEASGPEHFASGHNTRRRLLMGTALAAARGRLGASRSMFCLGNRSRFGIWGGSARRRSYGYGSLSLSPSRAAGREVLKAFELH